VEQADSQPLLEITLTLLATASGPKAFLERLNITGNKQFIAPS
jgi:hypothetical protein